MNDDSLEKYMKLIEARSATGEIESPDTTGMEAEDMAAKNYEANAQADYQKVAAAGATPQNGNLTAAGDATMAGGMVGGNPYVAGAGLALSTVGKIDDAKRQSEQAKIDAYNKKIMAQRSAIRNMFA